MSVCRHPRQFQPCGYGYVDFYDYKTLRLWIVLSDQKGCFVVSCRV